MEEKARQQILTKKSILLLCCELAVFVSLLLYPAGRVIWLEGWIFIGIVFVNTFWISWWLYRNDPELLKERLRFSIQKEQPFWDKLLILLFIVAGLAWCIIAGLDAERFRFSILPPILKILGAGLLQAGFLLQLRSFEANRFLIAIVSYQQKRGHKLVEHGPYRVIRHPFYTGMSLMMIGGALLLGSWMAQLISFLMIGLLMIRIQQEEKLLMQNLQGYREYQQKTSFRLIPYLW
ncbi:MAG: isoprenylcysteine carboxylmethyltransferase family protein [Sneathiellales bacterium]|nr:isoprenylcysteine carboxylmethyltransferase family protein [Sneathiellales bacterium]